MISFDLSDEHKAVEQTVREWAGAEVAPKIHDLDREHRFEREVPRRAWPTCSSSGICIPEEYGGAGMDYISLGLVSEELEYVDTHLRVIMSVHVGPQLHDPLVLGHRGAEEEVPRAPGQGREDRDLRPHRAQRGLATPSASRPRRSRRATATS